MAEIGKLKASLEPSSEKFIAACLKALTDRGWIMSNGRTVADLLRAYVEVLTSKGPGPIKRVTDKMIRGEYEFSDRGFIPIPAYFARLCDDEHAAIREQIIELKRADKRRLAIWNTLPDHWNNRQREERIDQVLSELDGIDAELVAVPR